MRLLEHDLLLDEPCMFPLPPNHVATLLIFHALVLPANQYQIPEGANEYNIWYGRYMGDHWKRDSGAGRSGRHDALTDMIIR